MANQTFGVRNTQHGGVTAWVKELEMLCRPERVFWCDGSVGEKEFLILNAVTTGVLTPLDQEKWPGCYYHRSDPNDVARVEHCTYICSETEEEAGPTNNWAPPAVMRAKLLEMARGAMRGGTMYVVPYLMGPLGSPLSKIGVEVTDSIYVTLSMRIMTRMGQTAYDHLGDDAGFNRGLHCMLDGDPERRFIAHFPHENSIISLGSNYGGNVLLGKKCLALRIGSYLGRREGWMAEHMLILGVESPEGRKTYVAAAFPSACGKTNFAMLVPPERFRGWKVWTVGDDIAWMRPGSDGRLYAINPERGYFGVIPGTNERSNPNAMATIRRDTIFTNVALTETGDIWWEGKDGDPPAECRDWRGHVWTPACTEKAAHPNSRFAAPMENNPVLAPEVDEAEGVPISAILFGGRRADTMPLVFQSFDWEHGVYLGATMSSETTAAAVGTVGNVRRDPMAMLPFCGYHMADYFQHWLEMGNRLEHPPAIFHVNWFRKDENGQLIWPGFGENMRVLKWIIDRCQQRVGRVESAIGWLPDLDGFDVEGLEGVTPETLNKLFSVEPEEWKREVLSQGDLIKKLQNRLPETLMRQRELLLGRLQSAV